MQRCRTPISWHAKVVAALACSRELAALDRHFEDGHVGMLKSLTVRANGAGLRSSGAPSYPTLIRDVSPQAIPLGHGVEVPT